MCLCCYGWPITMPRRAKFRCKIQDAATPFSKSKRRSIKPGEVLIFISNWTLHSATFSHAGLRHRMRNKSLSASTKIHTPLLTLSTKLQRQVYAPESSMYKSLFLRTSLSEYQRCALFTLKLLYQRHGAIRC